MSTCNRCLLNALKRRARKEGHVVTVRVNTKSGGNDAYTHPPEVKITSANRNRYWIGWYLSIPRKCEC